MNIFKDVAAKRYKLAVWSMALGITGFCLSFTLPGLLPLIITNIVPFVLGMLAWIFAAKAKKNYYTLESATTSTIGMITGIVASVYSGAMIIIPVTIVVGSVIVGIVTAVLAAVAPALLASVAPALLSELASILLPLLRAIA